MYCKICCKTSTVMSTSSPLGFSTSCNSPSTALTSPRSESIFGGYVIVPVEANVGIDSSSSSPSSYSSSSNSSPSSPSYTSSSSSANSSSLNSPSSSPSIYSSGYSSGPSMASAI